MRKIFFSMLAICTFFVSTTQAQLAKGKKYLGANVGFSSGTNKNTVGNTSVSSSTSSITLMPDFGYFFADNMSVGLGIGIGQTKSKPSDTQTNTTNMFSINPHFRYWVPTSSEQFTFFAQARLGIGSGTVKSETQNGTITTTTENSVSAIDFFVSPNFAFFPTKSWMIEFGVKGIGFESTTTTLKNSNPERKTTTSNFVLDVNSFSPSLGFRYMF